MYWCQIIENDHYHNKEFIETILDKHRDILHLSKNDIADFSFDQLKGGSNVNFKITFSNKSKIFFKHNPKPIESTIYGDTLQREYKILTHLYNESRLTPKPYIYDCSENVLITEFVDGRTPNMHDKDFFKTLTLLGNSLNSFRTTPIQLLQEFNTGTRLCPRNFFEKVLNPSIAKYTKKLLLEGSTNLFQFLEEITGIMTDKLKYEPKSDCNANFSAYLENPKNSPHGLIHNDMALRNIIITNDPNRPICFIDWEFADFGDIAYDLAYLQSENQLLTQQIEVISKLGHLSSYVHERSLRYIRIYLPMLELINCYWTIDHISQMISPEESQEGKKLKLRSPYTLSENLDFINNKIKRLVRLSKIDGSRKQNEIELLNEIQVALKLFERQLVIE